MLSFYPIWTMWALALLMKSNPKVVGSIPTLVRVFLCPCVGPPPPPPVKDISLSISAFSGILKVMLSLWRLRGFQAHSGVSVSTTDCSIELKRGEINWNGFTSNVYLIKWWLLTKGRTRAPYVKNFESSAWCFVVTSTSSIRCEEGLALKASVFWFLFNIS